MDAKIKWEQIRVWLLWLALPLLLGLLAAAAIPRPVIGIIYLYDAIDSYAADNMIVQIDYAIENPEVRAVVLAFDSPGGTVVDTEAVYFELSQLRAKKPVVVAVNGMAASGAYYLSANSDYIYAKPTSLVGNIGVIGYLPPTPFVIEDVISTGPYKLWGAPRDSDMRQIDMIKEAFYQAVQLGRGDKLKIERDEILSGQIWSGIDATRMGIADELGGESDAIKKAAELAHVSNYKVENLYVSILESLGIDPYTYVSASTFFLKTPEGATLPYPSKAGIYLLYIPQLPFQP